MCVEQVVKVGTQEQPVGHYVRRRTVIRLDVSRLQGFTGEDTADGAPPALEAECERLVGLGATRLRRDEPAPPTSAGYIVMADPEGNEFCLD
jgi:hypothetical protein